MRRKQGELIPLEISILRAGLEMHHAGMANFHGYMLSREMKDREHAGHLAAHGTLYKALERLENAGMVASEWEDPLVAARESRPRRRLYRVMAAGRAALASIDPERLPARALRLSPGEP